MASIIFLILTIFLSSRTSLATSRGSSLFEASAMEKHEKWMTRFHRVYADESEKRNRFDIFKKNLEFIQSFNKNRNTTYKLEVNEFSDLTDEEFRATHTGLVVPEGINGISILNSKRCRLDILMLVILARAWIGDKRGRLHPLSIKADVVIN